MNQGGFGSLLRAFGKQITMSTNKEACRDLTGRRIRHVNNEKKLKDFLEKQNELAKQKEETKREKAERRKKKRDKLEAKHHLFVDANYDKQKEKISQDLDEAITKAIEQKKITKQIDSDKSTEAQVETETQEELKVPEEVAKPSTSFTKLVEPLKKKSNDTVSNNKMFSDWMGCNDLEVSSSSSEDELTLPAKSKHFETISFLLNLTNSFFKFRNESLEAVVNVMF